MVTGAAAGDAVNRAKRLPDLRVGLHLVLVDGVPALPPSAVAGLVDGAGRFRSSMVVAGMNFAVNPRARRQLKSEIRAQFEAFRRTGLALDHCNAHKHFHVHPVIGQLLLEIGVEYGMRAIRVPLEPPDTLRQIEPGARAERTPLLDGNARRLLRQARARGLFAPERVFGIRWSGAMTRDRLLGLIRALPDGVSEIYCHPATAGGFAGSAPGYHYQEEFEALTDRAVIAEARRFGITVGGFVDFANQDYENPLICIG